MSTVKPNAELAAAFKAARKYLSPTRYDCNGKHEFICHCLNRAESKGEISGSTRVKAHELIHDRLGGAYSLQSWLYSEHPELVRAIKEDREGSANGARTQATRLAWLNSLIKEFGGRP